MMKQENFHPDFAHEGVMVSDIREEPGYEQAEVEFNVDGETYRALVTLNAMSYCGSNYDPMNKSRRLKAGDRVSFKIKRANKQGQEFIMAADVKKEG